MFVGGSSKCTLKAHSQGCCLSCLWTACKITLYARVGLVSEYGKGLGFVTGESASRIFGDLALGLGHSGCWSKGPILGRQ